MGGLASGGALSFGILAWEWAPAWIENYQTGAFGEQRTAKALEPLLRRGWLVIHDVTRRRSNIDHVLVGPGGIFVLDSKNWSGSAEARGDWLRITRPDGHETFRSKALASRARAQAKDLNGMLRQRADVSRWVSAVVVLWMDFSQRAVEGDNMAYVHGEHLADWLLVQPARLNAAQIDRIAAALQPGQRRRAGESEPSGAAS